MKTFYMLLLLLVTGKLLSAHEDFIKGVMHHSPYLQEKRVQSIGDLHLIRSNKLNQTLNFSQIKAEDLYGIGMPEGLNSELLISAGDMFEGKFENHQYFAKKLDEDRKIAFLAYVNVKKWKAIDVPQGVVSFQQLEDVIPSLAKKAGINIAVPFPFILKSKVKGLRWFIVNGMGNGQPDFLSSFLRSRFLGGLENVDIEGIGFYSSQHKGILSSPSSNMHIHFRTLGDSLFVGHIDNDILLEEGAEVLFPH